MKSLINFNILKCSLSLAALMLVFGGCTREGDDETYSPDVPLTASFTVTPVAGSANKFVITNTTQGSVGARWDYGKGTGLNMGKMVDTVFYPDAGSYTLKMQALSKRGNLYDAQPKDVTVNVSDPAFGNLIKGGKMEAGDDAEWTVLHIGSDPNIIKWTMADGKYTAKGGGSWNDQTGIYQAIQVEANKKYQFSALISGGGMDQTWYEVYFGTQAPVQGSDYSNGGNYLGLNTWGGCGVSTFSGNFATIGCSGSLVGKNGIVTFGQTGTLYLVIKSGSGSTNGLGPNGVSITNIELRGI